MGPNSMGRSSAAAPAAGGGLVRRLRKDGGRRLAPRPAPEDARLPSGEARLVHEFEVEERAHVLLAGRECDRFAEPLRLELGRECPDVLTAVVAMREAGRHLRLV